MAMIMIMESIVTMLLLLVSEMLLLLQTEGNRQCKRN